MYWGRGSILLVSSKCKITPLFERGFVQAVWSRNLSYSNNSHPGTYSRVYPGGLNFYKYRHKKLNQCGDLDLQLFILTRLT